MSMLLPGHIYIGCSDNYHQQNRGHWLGQRI
jgi:hypothetical protein